MILTASNVCTPSRGKGFLEITIQGTNIRLVFAAGPNTEAAVLVREILKSGYLRRQSV